LVFALRAIAQPTGDCVALARESSALSWMPILGRNTRGQSAAATAESQTNKGFESMLARVREAAIFVRAGQNPTLCNVRESGWHAAGVAAPNFRASRHPVSYQTAVMIAGRLSATTS